MRQDGSSRTGRDTASQIDPELLHPSQIGLFMFVHPLEGEFVAKLVDRELRDEAELSYYTVSAFSMALHHTMYCTEKEKEDADSPARWHKGSVYRSTARTRRIVPQTLLRR